MHKSFFTEEMFSKFSIRQQYSTDFDNANIKALFPVKHTIFFHILVFTLTFLPNT